ncbi:MAG TPA: histidine kinase [Anaerolineales bacterium]|nr:histidine kinase [Anaerolineales bacterium]
MSRIFDPSRFSWRGLTPQMFAIVILPLTLLLIFITFGGLRLHQLSMRDLVGERDVRSARAAANALSEQLKHRKSAIQSLALQSETDSSPDSLLGILNELSHLLPDFDKGLAFFNQQLVLLEYIGDGSFWLGLDLKASQIQEKIAGTSDPVTFLTIPDPASASQVILVISNPGPENMVAVGAFSPELLIELALADVISPSSGGYAFVIDQEKRLLHQAGGQANSEEDLLTHPGVSEALNGASGSTYLQIGRDEHVVAYSPVEPVGWALVIEETWDVVTSPLLRITEYAPLVMIPILLLAMLALWFGTNRIVQPLRSLEVKASALGWGDFEAINSPVGGVAEIRHLQTELIHLSQKVKAAQQGLRGYIGVMTRGLEEERRRLARELHDDTLQSLIALNQRLQLARMSTDGSADGKSLDEIQRIAENTIQDLRRVTKALRPIYLEDLGLVAALEMLVRETRQLHGLEVRFHRDGVEQRLSEEVELALYRMVQEALSNVVRHADATRASVDISFSPSRLIIQVADDGQGFSVPDSPSAFAPGGHYGLLGLFERAELIGAKLEIFSEHGEGTRIVVSLPTT